MNPIWTGPDTPAGSNMDQIRAQTVVLFDVQDQLDQTLSAFVRAECQGFLPSLLLATRSSSLSHPHAGSAASSTLPHEVRSATLSGRPRRRDPVAGPVRPQASARASRVTARAVMLGPDDHSSPSCMSDELIRLQQQATLPNLTKQQIANRFVATE